MRCVKQNYNINIVVNYFGPYTCNILHLAFLQTVPMYSYSLNILIIINIKYKYTHIHKKKEKLKMVTIIINFENNFIYIPFHFITFINHNKMFDCD